MSLTLTRRRFEDLAGTIPTIRWRGWLAGPIHARHAALGGDAGVLGAAAGPVQFLPDGGQFRDYARGSIYWSAATGAHGVWGQIRDKWRAMGAERSFLGYPTTDETATTDPHGAFNHFQSGSIYWSPATGPWSIKGAIRERWLALGAERSLLGFPTSDETDAADGRVRFSNFERGQIAWSPEAGAAVAGLTGLNDAQRNQGGLRPQHHGGSHGPWTTVRRRLQVNANMFIQDHENFGSNEHARRNAQNMAYLTSDVPGDVLTMVARMGGEIRVELSVEGQALLSGDVRVIVRAQLFEGTSEDTTDLDGTQEHTMLVPRDGVLNRNFRVTNTDEGDDDFAEISLAFWNVAA
ncbi:MAG: hypothetical protein K2X11_04055 [Acetobacteraceae bacterium]|nr:hypothetical protein [Acetobacteraceae bacterium]